MSASLTIGQLAKRAGLSRTTLLYYEQAGLLPAASRSPAGYRRYGESEVARLETIRAYRATGMPLDAIGALLADGNGSPVIRKRLEQVSRDIAHLHEQQAVLIRLLSEAQVQAPLMDKDGWTAMLRGAGLDDAGMRRWHALFERQAPAAHEAFLLSLGIGAGEVARIRGWASDFGV